MFEEMGGGELPLAGGGRFVGVERPGGGEGDGLERPGGKAGDFVDGIDAEEDEGFDFAGVEGVDPRGRLRSEFVGADGREDLAGAAAGCAEDEGGGVVEGFGEGLRRMGEEVGESGWRDGPMVIGHAAGDAGAAFDDMEAVGVFRRAAGRELACVAEGVGVIGEEVLADGDDEVGLREVVVVSREARIGVVEMDGGAREFFADLVELEDRGGRGGGGEDEMHAFALRVLLDLVPPGGGEGGPGGWAVLVKRGGTAVGIVEIENGGLRDRVGGAEGGGMVGIALDLGRASVIRADDDAAAVSAE